VFVQKKEAGTEHKTMMGWLEILSMCPVPNIVMPGDFLNFTSTS